MIIRASLAFASLLLLAACNGDDPAGESSVEQGGKAAGEVLGGTISDDMLALDQLTSTSPPAKPVATGSPDDGASADDVEDESEGAEPANADPTPEEPAAEE